MPYDFGWLAALRAPEREPARVPPATPERSDRVADWRKQRPFAPRADIWKLRLEEEELDEQSLGRLFGESLEALGGRIAPPSWVLELESLLAPGRSLDPALTTAIAKCENRYLKACLRLVAPFAEIEPLREAIANAARGLPIDQDRVLAGLVAHHAALGEHPLVQSVGLEVNVARKRGLLSAATPEARFDEFIDALADPDVLPFFWKRHPALARHMLGLILAFSAAVREVLEHLATDWPDVAATLAPQGRLAQIDAGRGDSHRGGRTVMKLVFEGGPSIIYKPRTGAADEGYRAVARWLAEHAARDGETLEELRTPRLLSRADRSYHELIVHGPCRSKEELARYFTRQGIHLALLYVLGAADMHAENLVAAGEDPVLIDLEALFQPRFRRLGLDVNPANEAAMTSVLRTLFLPMRVSGTDDAEGYDISALGAHGGQLGANEVPMMVDIGTDHMHVEGKRPEVHVPESAQPTLDGAAVDVSSFCREIADGFARAWRVIERHKEAFVRGPLQPLRDAPVRVIPRATQLYATMLLMSFHPSYVENALERERVFDRLYLPLIYEHRLERLIPSERADLHAGDVPFFTMRPASRDVIDSRGRVIPDFFDAAPFAAAEERILAMSEAGLRQQQWIIEASFATIPMGKAPDVWSSSDATLPPAPVGRDRLIERAVRIGDRLLDLAVREGDRIGWLGLTLAHEREWSIRASSSDLYAGSTGIALFLAYLEAVTGDRRYREPAVLALETALAELRAALASGENPFRIGALGEVGGPVFALAHLGALWKDPSLLDRGEALVPQLAKKLPEDESLDVLDGAAGGILAMLALHAARPSPAGLAFAAGCAERLHEKARAMASGKAWDTSIEATAPLGGFAHGTAGIALALHRLAKVAGEPRHAELAREALAYEHSLYDPETDNWRDLRSVGSATFSLLAWCHGASGVGLAMHECGEREDARRAIATVARRGFGLNHSICHGDFGNLELLFAGDEASFPDRLARTCASLDQQGPLGGVPLGVETPGLFIGLAGIGWQLLRFAEPTRVPSILAIEPPPR